MARVTLGTSSTDNNGVGVYSYTGTGAGVLEVLAIQGQVSSNHVQMIDANAIANSITGNTSIRANSTVDGTTLYLISSNSAGLYYFGTGNSTSNQYSIPVDGVVEFDLLSFEGSFTIRLDASSTLNIFKETDLTDAQTGHIKIVNKGTSIIAYLDDNILVNLTGQTSTSRKLTIRVEAGNTLTIQDLLYY